MYSQLRPGLGQNIFPVSYTHLGTYGLSATDGRAEITLLNSAAYCAHPVDDRVIMPDDRFGARIDQGERSYDFEFNFSSAKERELCAEAESRLAHQPPYALSFFPTGNGKACAEFGSISNPAVTLSAIRSSYDGKNKIVRLYNSLETPAETEIFLPFAGIKEKVGLKGYQFKTFIPVSYTHLFPQPWQIWVKRYFRGLPRCVRQYSRIAATT